MENFPRIKDVVWQHCENVLHQAESCTLSHSVQKSKPGIPERPNLGSAF
ncbi:hypothetical protein HMPREF9104_02639 [Lentilactobacillus kisonensis F0435]|uniref:Uncharacterized protein n=1 Tax=Lentilactobacillus kisonensis F0435 TaxID=797516 RepID=H1LJ47_9LACO|nr:hypothetical protein HMPREF9104_02639 [Lentilactobacillus kisonensis F0435]